MPIRTPPDRPAAAASPVAPADESVQVVVQPDPPNDPPTGTSTLAGWAPPIDGHGLYKSLMLRLPRGIRRSLDHEQLLALRQAAEELAWGEHPIDIRLALPWPGGRVYVVVLAGRDRRLRRRNALVRVGNLASMATLIGLVAGLSTLAWLAAGRLFGG